MIPLVTKGPHVEDSFAKSFTVAQERQSHLSISQFTQQAEFLREFKHRALHELVAVLVSADGGPQKAESLSEHLQVRHGKSCILEDGISVVLLTSEGDEFAFGGIHR